MSSIRAFPRIMIAIFSVVATMLGALEHESLLFQDKACTEAKIAVANSENPVTAQGAANSISRDGSETGTEGTYRSETQVLWTAPTDDLLTSWRVPEYDSTATRLETAPHLSSQARFRVARVLALRI